VSIPGSAGREPAGRVVLVKHALPVLDQSTPARDWRLGADGEAQAARLAVVLGRFAPFRLVASTEPKAARTAAIVAAAMRIGVATVAALGEIDRPRLPIMAPSEYATLNARLFERFDERVIGKESAREARDRFVAAVLEQIGPDPAGNLVVVAHGTVIALLVAAYNPISAFDLWTRLHCPSFVVLERGTFALVETVEKVA
jgi:2,3-bisphosphoglycerate-dependent phosphoglycerate mutase